jgi:hypothetical protein
MLWTRRSVTGQVLRDHAHVCSTPRVLLVRRPGGRQRRAPASAVRECDRHLASEKDTKFRTPEGLLYTWLIENSGRCDPFSSAGSSKIQNSDFVNTST